MGNIYIGGSSGSGSSQIQYITATASVTSGSVTGWNYTVIVDCTANNMTVTIPTSTIASYKGQNITIKRIDNSANTCVIIPSTATESIDGIVNGKVYLYNKNDAITLLNLGTGDSKISSDNRNSVGSTASYLRAYTQLNVGQSVVANTNIVFPTVEAVQGSNISYNNSTGIITLQPNVTFRLRGFLGYVTYSNVEGYGVIQFFNIYLIAKSYGYV
jgi:hypothetical protein